QRDTIKPAVIDRRYKGPLSEQYNVHARECSRCALQESLSLREKVCRWARKAVAAREKLSLHEKSCRWTRKAVAAREKLSLHEKSCRCTRNVTRRDLLH